MSAVTTKPKERGMLFSAPMVRAILEGRKTQTRRLLKPQPILSERNPPKFKDAKPGDLFIAPDVFPSTGASTAGGRSDTWVFALCESIGTYRCLGKKNLCDEFCPHGQVSDRLWVRETYYQRGYWQATPGLKTKAGRQKWAFRAASSKILFDPPSAFRKGRHHKDPETVAWHKRLGRFMPRQLSRITLEITEVRVERLRDISGPDAMAEGWPRYEELYPNVDADSKARGWYMRLWESINGRGSWDENPWVWKIEFRRIK